ncbi:TetR/AcrR family transcriptional regulator [Amycolatopsis acidiphila]|uniref:TetR/AcrR family transcriptional regulator n=1 Tax=Amycolatopsis acidiphila TaxID=715473 RepID=A0A558A1Z0_9PSEU|nr:TetR/AcrR family transcriptional regulator [Amycolatopsis acidiphila]TVT18274.1 TetR/AcrR family transcriptional regulator [Amycolatopsis acidiphila]UIJ57962.1 TetR/AcrR family transcriptional regulator [Amycolatopsis acidiphila]GHG70868.1 TetR family transcriptional regulator [Amycolatopsis acidiphila]
MSETRSRRRGEQLETAILDAAWAELNEVGYRGLTMERVASRAGTSKPVIYRRWANRAELVLAAWGRQVPERSRPVDTGGLRSDLLELFSRLARRTEGIMNGMIAGVMAEAFRDPEVTALLQQRINSAPLAEGLRRIVARAAERGELPPLDLPRRAVRLPLDLIRNEAMICGSRLPEDAVTELVDDVYLPLLHGLGSR